MWLSAEKTFSIIRAGRGRWVSTGKGVGSDMLYSARLRMVQGFYTLSVELIIEIFSYLEHHDLLRCYQVAKRLQEIIFNTPALEYKVELGLTGNQDGSSSSSITERLARLRRLQHAWENPKPRLVDSIVAPSQSWSHSKWQKDVFFGRYPTSADRRRLEVFNISAAFAGKERLQDLSFDVPFDAYSVDFDQDLIALVRNSDSDDKSLPVESIIVWHWPTGALKSDDGCINAMCTDSGYLLVAKRPGHPPGRFGIFVYALADSTSRLLATFELPRLRWDFRAWLTASFFPREHTCGALHGGLSGSKTDFVPASVLVQFQWDRQYTLYTPLATFLSPEVLGVAHRHLHPSLYFPWDKWGPHSTRIFTEGNAIADICGYRAIFPDYILDFSPQTLRNAMSDSEETRDMIMREPNTVAEPVFAEPVSTSLPYRRITLTLPSTPNTAHPRSQMYRAFVDVDGPKLLRVTCDYILVPSSVEMFSLAEQDD
ncbi:hypothetical protein BDY19DRAFT_1030854 [Irpex rosettiformis]|uniref:Uncharacterized protein n=1 Tax=Irpex rosettiformis TaxID=378272 RepID=A0ACB8UBU4_9APHY|nr:hypothetical protein BDY19DRAFT_1030854 [Irpex rosettiformis]